MPSEVLFFSGFIAFIILMLFLDLGLFSKTYHVVSFRESLIWTIVWLSLSMGFYLFLYFSGNLLHGLQSVEELSGNITKYMHPVDISGLGFEEAKMVYNKNLSLEYLTGYIIEYALSIDNVFVMILIFSAFGVKEKYFKKVLFWGILGAIVMRFIFIFLSSALIQKFDWILLLFGGILFYTGGQMLWKFIKAKKKKIDPEHHPVVKLASKYFAVHPRFEEHKFWIRQNGKLLITPLFLVLLVIEFTDVIFAVDSVPAIFAVTKDPYIVFFSNIFAIIGLRSLFFLLSNVINRFYFLKAGLAVLLIFIGLKMPAHYFHIVDLGTRTSLFIVVGILGVSVIISWLFPKKRKQGIEDIKG